MPMVVSHDQASYVIPMNVNQPASPVTPRQRKLQPPQIEAMFATFHAVEPEPKGELNYENVYTLLVAVALSAQATDVSVNKATARLFQEVTTPQQMLTLGEEQLKSFIKTIGLYNSKAKNIIATAKILVEEHNGQVPRDRDALEALPGIGRKTANVVLQMYWGEPRVAVDTHVFRVANRTGLAPGKTPLAVEKALEARIPQHFLAHSHHWLILHGRYLCKARKPECWRCPVSDFCCYRDKTEAPLL